MNATNPPSTPIENVQQLKEYLQVALQLEHATIPVYLTGAYTAKIEANKCSSDIIKAVAKEEMLHLTLAGNLLNAVGGSPDLVHPAFVPNYPIPLPSGETDFTVSIEKLSDKAIQTFLKIERPSRPEKKHAPIIKRIRRAVRVQSKHLDQAIRGTGRAFIPCSDATDATQDEYGLQYDIAFIADQHLRPETRATRRASILPVVKTKDASGNDLELHYWSIGDFYEAIHLGFVHLTQTMGERNLFTGNLNKQVGPEYYYSAGGELTKIIDLNTALAAIDLIAGQGEGSHDRIYDEEGELAHLFRFDQIQKRRYYRRYDEQGGDKPFEPRGGPFPVDMKAVYPIKTDAKIADYDAYPDIKDQALLFNEQYKQFLQKLHQAFNGKPELLRNTFAAEMFRIKATMERLIRNPIPGTDENASPTFEMNNSK